MLLASSLITHHSSLPSSADALREYQNAVGNESRGEYYTAVLNLRRCITESPNFVPAHLLMGDVLVKLGKFSQADSSYIEAEQKDPNSVDAATRRLKLYALHLRDFDRAEKLLSEVASRFEQSAEIHYYKALVLMGKHNYLNARSELKLAIALREKYFDARKLQIEVESVVGDPKKILDAASVILEDFPDRVESYEVAVGHLLKARIPVEQILELFSNASPQLLGQPRFSRMLARMNLMADRYPAAGEVLKTQTTEGLTADEIEDLVYLRSLSDVANGRHAEGIQILADYLRDAPDRPYLLMQLDLWLIRYAGVADPLRIQRAADRLKIGRQLLIENRRDQAFISLYLARKLNPRDKHIRRYFAESAWLLGLAETAKSEIRVALSLDPDDGIIWKRAKHFGDELPSPTDESKRRIYNLYVFRLSDEASSIRPSFGRLLTDAIALFAEAWTPFGIQALEPAVPFEKAEEVAHQKNADFFLHGDIGLDAARTFIAELGIYPVGSRGLVQALEFKEQHIALKSGTDFTEDVIFDAVKALQATSSQYAKVVKKEREGNMIVDVGRRHGMSSNDQYAVNVFGGVLYADITHVYEWFSRVRVQEIERARFVGIGDYLKRVDR